MPQKDQFSYTEAVPNSLLFLLNRLYISSQDVPILDEWIWHSSEDYLNDADIANLIAAIVLYELGYD